MVIPLGPEKNQKKKSVLPLNDFINVAPNLIESKKIMQGWISINKIHELQELYAASTQVVCHIIILDNSADPANISDLAIIHLLQKDTLASANHISTIDISSIVMPKSLESHHALPVNDKVIWDTSYKE